MMAHECNMCGVPLAGSDNVDGVCGDCYQRSEGRTISEASTFVSSKVEDGEIEVTLAMHSIRQGAPVWVITAPKDLPPGTYKAKLKIGV